MEEENKETVRELLEDIRSQNKELIEKKETKKWKFPWNARVNGKKANKGWATFCIVHDNREVEFAKSKIEDEAAKLEGMYRYVTADDCLHFKGNPFYIINSGNLKCYNPQQDRKTAEELNMGSVAGSKVLLAKMEKEALSPKKGGFSFLWIILIIGGIVLLYYILKGGKLF